MNPLSHYPPTLHRWLTLTTIVLALGTVFFFTIFGQMRTTIFPKGSKGRTFQFQWLKSFTWLVYSKQTNGGFCLPYILFAPSGYCGSYPGVLVTHPLTNFKKALEMLRKYTDKEHHKVAVVWAEEFQKSMSGQQLDIQQRMSKSLAETISMNRQKLSSIMKTILFCGQ